MKEEKRQTSLTDALTEFWDYIDSLSISEEEKSKLKALYGNIQKNLKDKIMNIREEE